MSFLRLFDIHFQFVCAAIFYFTSYHFSTDGNGILWLSVIHLLVRTMFLYQHCVDPKHSLIEMITLISDCFIKLTIICFYGMKINIIAFQDESRYFFLKIIIGGKFKGKKMAGHMGDKLRTMQNIEIIKTRVLSCGQTKYKVTATLQNRYYCIINYCYDI